MLQLAGSLFSGAGALDIAVNRVFGTRTAWFSEFDAKASSVLEHRFPGVPNLGDITKIDWPTVPYVRVLSGGSPCQDLSLTGPRTGMVAGTRSGLWDSMREGIAVLRPQFVVWENVKGALSGKATSRSDVEREPGRVGIKALGRVLGDLSSLGYDSAWGVVRASDAGLPHRRERVFVVASYTNGIAPGQRPFVGDLAGTGVPTQTELPPPFTESGVVTPNNEDEGSVEEHLVRYGPYAEAIARAEAIYGPAPEPLVDGRLNPKFSEWSMGWTPGWASDVPGIAASDALKITGNGVAPPQAELAIQTLLGRLNAR